MISPPVTWKNLEAVFQSVRSYASQFVFSIGEASMLSGTATTLADSSLWLKRAGRWKATTSDMNREMHGLN